MKPRWAPRWFQWIGIGPNPALPSPIGDNTLWKLIPPDTNTGEGYRWITLPPLGPKDEE